MSRLDEHEAVAKPSSVTNLFKGALVDDSLTSTLD